MNNATSDEQAPRDETILIVEDNSADAELFRRYLLNQGWQPDNCTIVDTADDAINRISNAPPNCVIIDYYLGESDGLTLLRRLSSALERDPIAVLIATGQGSERVAVQAMKLGAHDYITKDDLTPAKLRDAVIESLRRNTQKTQARLRLESLTVFVNAISHDLRRPLTSLGLNLDLHAESLEQNSNSDLATTLDGAQQSYNQLKDMLESLHRLVSSQSEPFNSTVLELSDLVQEALKPMNESLKQRNATVVCEALPTVVADRAIVIEIIQNLIDNAIKHSRAEPLKLVVKPALDRQHGQHSMAGLVVVDNGVGLSAEIKTRISEPRWDLHSIDAGVIRQDPQQTGLGLSICARLMDRLEGKLMADNAPSGGARFFVLFSSALSGTIDLIESSEQFCVLNQNVETQDK